MKTNKSILLPAAQSLLNTSSQLRQSASLPIEAEESKVGIRESLAVALALLLFVAGFIAMTKKTDTPILAYPFVAFGLFMVWQGGSNWYRIHNFGPARVSITEEGLGISTLYSGILPWSETSAVYLDFSNGRIHTVRIKLQNPGYLDKRFFSGERDGEGFVKLNLGLFPNQNRLGESILAAANAFSGSHSAWGGLPWMSGGL